MHVCVDGNNIPHTTIPLKSPQINNPTQPIIQLNHSTKPTIQPNQPTTPTKQVDAHNVVPVWEASGKQEVGARTIRKKIHDKFPDFFVA